MLYREKQTHSLANYSYTRNDIMHKSFGEMLMAASEQEKNSV